VEAIKGEEENWAFHIAHLLPVAEGEVYTVLSDTADGPSFEVQHALALAAITKVLGGPRADKWL
jgi:hypothetical protein